VLSDLGQLETREGQVVLGAAVLDDVIGLVILSVVGAAAAGAGVTAGGVLRTTAVAVGFIVAALGRRPARGAAALPGGRADARVGHARRARPRARLRPRLPRRVGRVGAHHRRVRRGLVLHETPQRPAIEEATTTVGHLVVPVFFATVGASVDVRTLGDPRTLAVGGALVAAGVVGKFAAGYAPVWFRGRKALVGAAMIPRGEVGLIFAQMGLASGALTPALFSAVALMVLTTTFLAPPLLAILARRGPPLGPAMQDAAMQPGDGGIDDLVFGEHEESPATRRPATPIL
jgi:Kef-type K+ transport system membrane component KefB